MDLPATQAIDDDEIPPTQQLPINDNVNAVVVIIYYFYYVI
jgi:hypothetical protein